MMNKTHNKLMKNIAVVLCVFFPFVLQGQNDAKAERLLEKVSETIRSQNTIDIEFTYVLENRIENIYQEAEGNLKMKNNRYRLEFMGITQISDDKFVYTIVPENEEVTIRPIEDLDNSTITPDKLLKFYENGYRMEWDIIKKEGGKSVQFVKLIPIDSQSEINYLLLGINTSNYQIDQLIEIGKNKTRTVLKVVNYTSKNTLDDQLFQFNKNKYSNFYIDEY